MRAGQGMAVVTGASQGLGKAFAEAAAKRGWDLFLSSLPGEGLSELAEALAFRYGIEAVALELDLSGEEGQKRLVAELARLDRPIRLLINNAGIGDNGLFDRLPLAAQRRSVELNIQSTMALTYSLVPALAAAAPARIITVASLAAFQPMPLFAVYAASKAFLLHWGLALRQELAALGVGHTVLAPGGIYTNAANREKVRSQGLVGRLSTMEPELVAEAALRGAERGKALVIPGRFNRLVALAGCLLPRNLKAWLVHRRWEKVLRGVEASADAAYYQRAGRGDGRAA